MDDTEIKLATKAIRIGHQRTEQNEHSEPIFLTSSYVFGSAEEAAARFSGDDPGNIYSRFTNPTVQAFEQRLAAMEGGERCVATASGMSAILSVCMGILKSGDHIVSSRNVFGTTTVLFNQYMAKFGVDTTFVSITDYDGWEKAVKPNTRLLFLETPSNPLTEIADIPRLAELAHQHDCLLVIDNCFCTPAIQQPLLLGADVVVHSATKYLDGQGRVMGGAVVGLESVVGTDVYGFLRTAGPSMSAFNAWIFLKGLETLNIRMKAQSENANLIAHWLQDQPEIAKVHYPGLSTHAQHELAKQQQKYFGAIVAFELKGGIKEAQRLINGTQLLSITANLGDVKTTITHPATTTHGRLSPEEQLASGITAGLVRISVGLEDQEDLINDLQRALKQV